MKQITNRLLMIEPVAFRFNEQTAVNNYYQQHIESMTPSMAQEMALKEFNDFVQKLRNCEIHVTVVKDTLEPDTPDSIFPNNWISFHEDGRVGLYPMYAKNRRLERRMDILEQVFTEANARIKEIVDFTHFEERDLFLEGTGSMLLDRQNKICYAALSLRTEKEILEDFCRKFEFELVGFVSNQTFEGKRLPIYHTNVMMCLANHYAVICLDTIDNPEERHMVVNKLKQTNKEIIEITEEQKGHFAGNMLQVMGDQPYLVMSSSAFESLTQDQIARIEKYNPIIHSSLNTIEACGGGSARCMMAEVFLPE